MAEDIGPRLVPLLLSRKRPPNTPRLPFRYDKRLQVNVVDTPQGVKPAVHFYDKRVILKTRVAGLPGED